MKARWNDSFTFPAFLRVDTGGTQIFGGQFGVFASAHEISNDRSRSVGQICILMGAFIEMLNNWKTWQLVGKDDEYVQATTSSSSLCTEAELAESKPTCFNSA